ncbi:MAG: hypothetical protein M3081_09705 [Gemmatimonadota bacterium]|nr:hypothetical protein [Gemmatimonadota bacterium]
MRLRWSLLCALTMALGATAGARAQAVLGIGDDALTLPRGAFRIRVLHSFSYFDERYGRNTPFRKDGSREPLAVDFNLDTVGVAEFPNLAPLAAGLRQLTGMPDYNVTLGKTVLRLNAIVRAVPLVGELGITDKLSIGVTFPIVHTQMKANFAVNPNQREGNVGFNPALGSPTAATANSTLFTNFLNAITALNATLAACAVTVPPPSCAPINANRANLSSLASNAAAFQGGLAQVYGASPFVPVSGTDADLAIRARIAFFQSQFAALGIANLPSGAFPVAAPTVLGLADAQRILTDPAFAIETDRIENVDKWGLGDVEIGVKYQFLNTLGIETEKRIAPPSSLAFRSAATVVLRLGTGKTDNPDNFIDIGTGNGQTDIELRSQNDVIWGKHLWASFIARYGWQLPDYQVMRVTPADAPLAPSFRRQRVRRDLGDYYELEASPRYVINDFFAIAGQYLYRRKYEDRYTGTFNVNNTLHQPVTLDAAQLNDETGTTEHRFGGGIVFSTVASFTKGRAKIPYEISYQHMEDVAGSGGKTPAIKQDIIQFRIYTRLFGGE